MTCFHPIKGYRGPGGTLVTVRSRSTMQVEVTVPCGRCQGCRLDRSRDWSTRIQHEASLYEENSFVTLTYKDEHLPPGGNLSKRDFQLFMKRLRKSLYPAKVRYYGCGEYGDRNKRPHYHVILFGYRPADCYLWRVTKSGQHVYRAPSLEKIWTLGMSEIGTVTSQSGGYVARYCMKKSLTNFDARYDRVDPTTGEIWEVDPEFMVCSSVPMIGYGWLQQFESDAFPSDFVLVNGRKVPVPRAYRRKINEEENYRLRQARRRFAGRNDKEKIAKQKHERTPERLAVREEIQAIKIEKLNRNCEPDDGT